MCTRILHRIEPERMPLLEPAGSAFYGDFQALFLQSTSMLGEG